MTADELERATRVFLAQRPFRPFTVEFMSGPSALVQHPEALHRQGMCSRVAAQIASNACSPLAVSAKSPKRCRRRIYSRITAQQRQVFEEK